ncbi:PREDICTED: uncharacterized protein LOC109467506 [Branchiostoma belcheri]|uniref:Uncharacterized protein LOC109467506 n=1 Tax=Branchiostoma belcheri TaxID=7741 RepID=A0A6P4Y9B7_BRABE|nr:PREDICTED: uncharacterized protein LOC109467506 [Branchiostoma belcheri]
MALFWRDLLLFFLAALSVQASPLGKFGDQGVEVFYRRENPDSVPAKRWGGACLGCPPDPILISGRASLDDVPENLHNENPDSGPQKVPDSKPQEVPDSGMSKILDSGRVENPDSGKTEALDSGPRKVQDSGMSEIPESGRMENPEKRWGGECLGCPPDPIILLGKRSA